MLRCTILMQLSLKQSGTVQLIHPVGNVWYLALKLLQSAAQWSALILLDCSIRRGRVGGGCWQ